MSSSFNEQYYEALEKCFARYLNMISEATYWDGYIAYRGLQDFTLLAFKESQSKTLSIFKLNRWLGYVQGCLIERGLTSIEAERNWTRPLFKDLDKERKD